VTSSHGGQFHPIVLCTLGKFSHGTYIISLRSLCYVLKLHLRCINSNSIHGAKREFMTALLSNHANEVCNSFFIIILYFTHGRPMHAPTQINFSIYMYSILFMLLPTCFVEILTTLQPEGSRRYFRYSFSSSPNIGSGAIKLIQS